MAMPSNRPNREGLLRRGWSCTSGSPPSGMCIPVKGDHFGQSRGSGVGDRERWCFRAFSKARSPQVRGTGETAWGKGRRMWGRQRKIDGFEASPNTTGAVVTHVRGAGSVRRLTGGGGGGGEGVASHEPNGHSHARSDVADSRAVLGPFRVECPCLQRSQIPEERQAQRTCGGALPHWLWCDELAQQGEVRKRGRSFGGWGWGRATMKGFG